MKQEVFVGIIHALKQQEERNAKFAEAIQQAFTGAGECSDFRDSLSYHPPTSMLQDAILETLAKEFVSDHQTYEQALNLINYWFYDLAIENYRFMEPVDGDPLSMKSVPAYIEVNGIKVPLATPEDLFNELVATQTGVHNVQATETKPADLQNAMHEPTPSTPEGITGKVEKVVLEVINDFGTYEIAAHEPVGNAGLDSLDMVEVMMELECRFSTPLDDDDCKALNGCLTPADIATWLVNHKNLLVPV